MQRASGVVALVLKGYPRLSETFIAQEIHALERSGLRLKIYSLRRPTDCAVHPAHQEIAAPVVYLPEYLLLQPFRVVRGWWRARTLWGYSEALRTWLRDLRRDPTFNRIRRFGQGCVLAAELPTDVAGLHAHFLHTPASVARYASLLTGLPWSCSAHAKDIWTTPEWEKREKLAAAQWVVTCTKYGLRHLRTLAPFPDKIELVYHGLPLDRMPPPPASRPARNGAAEHDPVVILSVGRLVEKKGYFDLLLALARLPRELSWRLVHIGGGALSPRLRSHAGQLGLSGAISWLGAQPQGVVIEKYRGADLFVLASRVASDGDRDGLPNVLLEAQSQGLACLSTSAFAIPELIDHGVTGILVPPGDVIALAGAMERLIREPHLRARLGTAGARKVRDCFRLDQGLSLLRERFGLQLDRETEKQPQCGSLSTRQ